MTNVMSKAWGIAKEGQKKFGGKVKEYFAQALKIAWGIVKNAMNNLQGVKGTLLDIQFAELEGSEKQISWAKEIRKKAVNAMLNEIFHESYEMMDKVRGTSKIEKRYVKNLVLKMHSEESIIEYLKEQKEFHERISSAELAKEKTERLIKSMNGAYDRHARTREILSNTSAKFWIDNRDNQEKNYMFNQFRTYVATGEKLF